MQVKALLLCVAVAAALNVNLSAAEQPGVPKGWTLSPDGLAHYQVGYSPAREASYLRAQSAPDKALGALYQAIEAPGNSAGKLLTVEAEVLVEKDATTAMLFFRCRTDKAQPRSFSSVKPSGKWETVKASMISDEQNRIENCDFGLAMLGNGEAWVRNMRFSVTTPKPDHPSRRMPNLSSLPVLVSKAQPENLELRP
ncbi:hypothetical protein [Chitinimonas sp. BJYL2]|uniref:hypothetical protein n=1 Tax=Chitinimonas sp. BJYL2 TaxID=2976696 RepID=UPI0022B33B3D|nr:hypothetical protein [Chitinimonas sp. BJYL2]